MEVTRLRRLDHPDAGELEAGVLAVHHLEVARLPVTPARPRMADWWWSWEVDDELNLRMLRLTCGSHAGGAPPRP